MSRRGLVSRAITWPLLAGLRIYKRWLSPLLPPACRYLPTCSEYAQEALLVHGPVHGSWLAGKRLCRCHPWGGQGFDPVPGVKKSGESTPSLREIERK